MRTLLATSALALFAALPAHAVTVTSIDATNRNSGTVVTDAPGLLQVDAVLRPFGFVRFNLTGEAGDQPFDFDSFVEFNTGFGINALVVRWSGFTLSSVGSSQAAFSNTTTDLDPPRAIVRFKGREFVSVELGDLSGVGTDWQFNLADGATGFLEFTAVPAPAALALFGLGLGALALRRRG